MGPAGKHEAPTLQGNGIDDFPGRQVHAAPMLAGIENYHATD